MSVGTAKEYFDEVGIKYEEVFGHNPGQINFVKRSLDLINAGPAVSVLDIGQGTGKPTSALIAARGCKLHGIDISSTMVNVASKQVPQGTFEVANMLEYEAQEPFDAAFAIFSFFQHTHAEMQRLALRWSGWIKSGGHLFIGTMAADDYPAEVFQPLEVTSGDGNKSALTSVGHVIRKFMGNPCTFLIYTKQGWEEVLGLAGFELLHAETVPFQPEHCDWEPHYFITARRK